MLKEIKYNRSIKKFNTVLSSCLVIQVLEFTYFHDVGSDNKIIILYEIEQNEDIKIVRINKYNFNKFGLDVNLDDLIIIDIICNRFNLNKIDVFVNYGGQNIKEYYYDKTNKTQQK